jgi:uncharacterized membrane protein
MNLIASFGLCGLLAIHGLRKKSLSISGAIAAVLVGLLTFTTPLLLFSVVLLSFYLAGSRVTKVHYVIFASYNMVSVQGAEKGTARGWTSRRF